MKIYKFYIRLAGDNNYHKVMKQFVTLIASDVFLNKLSKEEIQVLFNRTAFELYLILNWSSILERNDNHLENLKKQIDLCISTKDIYFNEEFEQLDNSVFNGDGCLALLKYNNEIEYYIV